MFQQNQICFSWYLAFTHIRTDIHTFQSKKKHFLSFTTYTLNVFDNLIFFCYFYSVFAFFVTENFQNFFRFFLLIFFFIIINTTQMLILWKNKTWVLFKCLARILCAQINTVNETQEHTAPAISPFFVLYAPTGE